MRLNRITSKRFFVLLVTLVTCLELCTVESYGLGTVTQPLSQGLTSALNNAGSAASTAEGLRSIATGNQNQSQGERTQNIGQMVTGAMQVMSGLLGLAAAAAGKEKAGTSAGRESGLSSTGYNPNNYNYGSNAGTGSNNNGSTTGATSLGSSVANGINGIDISREPIKTGLASIEKNFGIPKEKLLEALAKGVAPKDIVTHAPKNAVSADLANRIADGLAASNAAAAADAAKNLAGSMNSSGSSLASPGGAGTGSAPSGSTEVDAGTRAPASTSSTELDDINTNPNATLSPEIKAAMAAKAEQIRREKEMQEMHGWSIFQLVANRYRKLEPMLYGRVERTNPNPVPPQVRN